MAWEKKPLKISGESEITVCTCMQSNFWPYCDASHHGMGGGEPETIKLDKNKAYVLCRCYKTKNFPFCDGSHKS